MGRRIRGSLYGRAWTHAGGPGTLFDHAVTWLRKDRVLLPGVSVLARQVSEARTAAERRRYEAVARAAHRADPALAPALAEALMVPEVERVSVECGRALHRRSRRAPRWSGPWSGGRRTPRSRAGAGGPVPGAGEPAVHTGPVRAAE
ncbi:DUF4158 domain-containing protein, partial [Streptomyces sp. TRM76130]|nr:DUF4158 domain-containing protein [Streptomyces sp. TRM76130]